MSRFIYKTDLIWVVSLVQLLGLPCILPTGLPRVSNDSLILLSLFAGLLKSQRKYLLSSRIRSV